MLRPPVVRDLVPTNGLVFLNIPNVFPAWHDFEFIDAAEGGHEGFMNRFAYRFAVI